MRTSTQLKKFFIAMRFALSTLTIVTAPAQVTGARQFQTSHVVVPADASASAQAVGHPLLPGASNAEGVSVSPSRRRTINSRATVQDSSLPFLPAVTYNSGGSTPVSIAVADLNGDSNFDLVVANQDSSAVAVLLGNGDGTFQTAESYSSGGIFTESVAVADVNGDGKPDLLVANENSVLGVLLGNGDGTFQAVVTYDSGGGSSRSLAVADVNGDGKPDLVVANCGTNDCTGFSTASVLLGNGDGTFQTAVSYPSGCCNSLSIAVADVNSDGNPDLLVANACTIVSFACLGHGTVGVLLGNGDGTFRSVVTYGSGGCLLALSRWQM
jgi:hypothetical protein